MPKYAARINVCAALVLTLLSSLAGRAFAQGPQVNDLQGEVLTLKAENAVVRELLRKMEEQQRALLEQVDRLQRRLDEGAIPAVQFSDQPQLADQGEAAADVGASLASEEVLRCRWLPRTLLYRRKHPLKNRSGTSFRPSVSGSPAS